MKKIVSRYDVIKVLHPTHRHIYKHSIEESLTDGTPTAWCSLRMPGLDVPDLQVLLELLVALDGGE